MGTRTSLIIVGVAAVVAALLPHAAAADGASGADVRCTTTFTGTAHDVIVPAGQSCLIDNATITHDVIVNHDASVAVVNTRIGHDLSADHPALVETGFQSGVPPFVTTPPGPVRVGHDITIEGSARASATSPPVGFDICDTTVGHDVTIQDAKVPNEIQVGDKGTGPDFEFCQFAASAPNTIHHDLTVDDNQAGRIDIGDNAIGDNMSVEHNTLTAPATPGYSTIDVSDNRVGETAECEGNSPAVSPASRDGAEDGPNHAERDEGCY